MRVVSRIPDASPVSKALEQPQSPGRLRLLHFRRNLPNLPSVVWTHCRFAVRRLGMVGMSGGILLLISLVTVPTILVPAQRAVADLRTQLANQPTSPALAARRADSDPEVSAGKFVNSLPSRAQLPAVLVLVAGQAELANLQLQEGTYQMTTAKSGGLARYQLAFPVKGSYLAVRQFVDGTLAAVPAAALESIRMERKDVSSGELEAELKFVVFVRGEP
jgi:hypothetical protein